MAGTREKFSSQASPELLAALRRLPGKRGAIFRPCSKTRSEATSMTRPGKRSGRR